MISLLDKYKPKRINQIIGHRNEISKIVSWITEFKATKSTSNSSNSTNSSKSSSLIISGEHGIGKSCSVDVIIDSLDYQKVKLDTNLNNLDDNELHNYLTKLISNDNILYSMQLVKKKDIIVVIDEVESISSIKEKAGILKLLQINEQYRYCPIIFISNTQHNKFLSEIKKHSIEVKFYPPTIAEIEFCLTKIITKENIRINNPSSITTLLNHSQRDIRRLIQLLDDIKYLYNNQEITHDMIYEYCNLSKMKDCDFNLFTATSNLLYNYKNIDDCLRLYETGKVLLPLMIHYNYTKNIPNLKPLTNKIADSLSNGDVIENYIYGDQNWDISEIHGIYTCVLPSYYMSKLIPKTHGKQPYQPYPGFTTDLNKTSIMKINRKNILNANQCFTNNNITDYLFMTQIVRTLIQNKRMEECVELLRHYNISLSHLESILKIDKIENEYNVKKQLVLTSKHKHALNLR